MDAARRRKDYLPMSETAYYILLGLTEVRHGYGIMQYVGELTGGRLKLGPGTLYGTLSRLEKDGLIEPVAEEDRRKLYRLTKEGRLLLTSEVERLGQLYRHGQSVIQSGPEV